ncbi:MAG: alpha/beta fold hydrolase [Dehalococcoidia bacterium]
MGASFRNGSIPTVLLVHGAFTDASSWASVIPLLLAAGIDVQAVANPLDGLESDAAYLVGVLGEVDGPVVLVGHSYGGAVITAAGDVAGNVVGLVYVAAFAVDAGESALDIAGRFSPSRLNVALRPTTFTNRCGDLDVELSIGRDLFASVFAADLPKSMTAVLAASQRPIAAAALEEKCPAAAWRSLPCWYLVATADQVIHPDAQRFMAKRARARTVEVDASHAVVLSQPAVVADLVRTAVLR